MHSSLARAFSFSHVWTCCLTFVKLRRGTGQEFWSMTAEAVLTIVDVWVAKPWYKPFLGPLLKRNEDCKRLASGLHCSRPWDHCIDNNYPCRQHMKRVRFISSSLFVFLYLHLYLQSCSFSINIKGWNLEVAGLCWKCCPLFAVHAPVDGKTYLSLLKLPWDKSSTFHIW